MCLHFGVPRGAPESSAAYVSPQGCELVGNVSKIPSVPISWQPLPALASFKIDSILFKHFTTL